MALAPAVMLSTQVAFVASTWTDARTWSLTKDDGFIIQTTTGNICGATKTSDEFVLISMTLLLITDLL